MGFFVCLGKNEFLYKHESSEYIQIGNNYSMSEREKYLKIITNEFSVWEVRLQNLTSQNLYDAHNLSEHSICELLNLIFDYKLKNLNSLKMNFPAIDLGDKSNSLCIQVTSTKSGKKVQETIEKFLENKLNEQYGELLVLILGKKQKSYSIHYNSENFSFDSKNQILDFRNLLNIIQSKPPNILEKISKILLSENSNGYKTKVNPNEKKVQRNIALKKRLQKAFLLKLERNDWEYSWFEPWRKFNYHKVLIRSIDDKSWPNSNENSTDEISSWFKGEFYDFYDNGIELISHGGRAIFDENDNWDLLHWHDDPREKNKSYTVTNYNIFLQIPYDYIIDFDMDTDPYDGLPSIFVKYEKDGMPYESILYGTPGSYKLRRLKYLFDENYRKPLK